LEFFCCNLQWVVGPWPQQQQQQHVTCLIVPPLEGGNKGKSPNNSIEAFVLWPWLCDTILVAPTFFFPLRGVGMQSFHLPLAPLLSDIVQGTSKHNTTTTYQWMDGSIPSFPLGLILLWMKTQLNPSWAPTLVWVSKIFFNYSWGRYPNLMIEKWILFFYCLVFIVDPSSN
jgi:hypothetical protein